MIVKYVLGMPCLLSDASWERLHHTLMRISGSGDGWMFWEIIVMHGSGWHENIKST